MTSGGADRGITTLGVRSERHAPFALSRGPLRPWGPRPPPALGLHFCTCPSAQSPAAALQRRLRLLPPRRTPCLCRCRATPFFPCALDYPSSAPPPFALGAGVGRRHEFLWQGSAGVSQRGRVSAPSSAPLPEPLPWPRAPVRRTRRRGAARRGAGGGAYRTSRRADGAGDGGQALVIEHLRGPNGPPEGLGRDVLALVRLPQNNGALVLVKSVAGQKLLVRIGLWSGGMCTCTCRTRRREGGGGCFHTVLRGM